MALGAAYFVLHGHLSPLDGIGPDAIGLEQLEARVTEGHIEEIIMATNPTVKVKQPRTISPLNWPTTA